MHIFFHLHRTIMDLHSCALSTFILHFVYMLLFYIAYRIIMMHLPCAFHFTTSLFIMYLCCAKCGSHQTSTLIEMRFKSICVEQFFGGNFEVGVYATPWNNAIVSGVNGILPPKLDIVFNKGVSNEKVTNTTWCPLNYPCTLSQERGSCLNIKTQFKGNWWFALAIMFI